MEKIVMNKAVKQMLNKVNWVIWLVLVIAWNFGYPQASPMEDVIVAVILSILNIGLKKYLKF